VNPGYIETICFECVNEYGSHTNDEFVIKQVMNCSDKFRPNEPVDDVWRHNWQNTTHTVGDSLFFFNNSEPVECPLTCSLKAEGCQESYEAGELNMTDEFPFEISASAAVELGFRESVCF